MGKGAKIALGCGCLVLLLGGVAVGVLGFGAFWATSKVKEATGGFASIAANSEQIEQWEQKASANAYAAPADGVIAEARLLEFLAARKQVFAVYQRYEAQFKELEARSKSSGREVSVSEAMSGLGKVAELFGEVRLAQMKALAEAGMHPDEYRDIQMAVYKSAWASESMKQSGKTPSEAIAEAGQKMQEQLAESADALGEAAQALEVPRANVELFRKHEAEIRKYAMSGLDLAGL